MFFQPTLNPEVLNERYLSNIDGHCGLKVTEIIDQERMLVAELPITEKVVQPFSLLHGGISCMLAESLGSVAGNLLASANGKAVGQNLQAVHLKSAGLGDTAFFYCKNIHSGRRSQVWETTVKNAEGKTLSKIILTLSILTEQ